MLRYSCARWFINFIYATTAITIFASSTFAESNLSDSRTTVVRNSYSEVIAGSSPDNALAVFNSAIDNAKKTIRLSAYKLPSIYLTDHLLNAAQRGVKIRILLDGWIVGKPRSQKVDLQDLHNAHRLVQAGAKVVYLASDRGPRDDRRFKFLHSKYAVIDDETLYISSENFGDNAFPISGSVGNRGWNMAIKNKAVASMYSKVFDKDNLPDAKFNDLVSYGASPDYTLQDKSYTPTRNNETGVYAPVQPALVKEKMTFERVLSPDDATATDRAMIGAIKTAQQTLVIQNLSFAPHWGKDDDTPSTDPSPVAEAVLDAARRGVSVRVMLNPMIFMTPDPKKDSDESPTKQIWESQTNLLSVFMSGPNSQSNTRDNDALIKYFHETAMKENLDLQASMLWVKENELRLLHNKGMVVDRTQSLISSINWVENSLKNNREVGIIVTSKKVADYYQNLFEHDWQYSRKQNN